MDSDVLKQVNWMGRRIVDFLLPPLCPATGEPVDQHGMVHAAYWQGLNFINDPICKTCGVPFSFEASDLECGDCLENPPAYKKNRSSLIYDDGCRDLILRFKHGDQTHAVRAFIPWLNMAATDIIKSTDIIVPVPLHYYRLLKRRFNQAELIARHFSRNYQSISYYPDGLLRIRNTQSQGHKKPAERSKNVKKAFAVNPKYNYSGRSVLIIDDVYTTGATLNECAAMLYSAGASEVNCLTLARAVKN